MVKCAYCSRPGKDYSNCAGCGAVLDPEICPYEEDYDDIMPGELMVDASIPVTIGGVIVVCFLFLAAMVIALC